jgi:hypothetical protein
MRTCAARPRSASADQDKRKRRRRKITARDRRPIIARPRPQFSIFLPDAEAVARWCDYCQRNYEHWLAVTATKH